MPFTAIRTARKLNKLIVFPVKRCASILSRRKPEMAADFASATQILPPRRDLGHFELATKFGEPKQTRHSAQSAFLNALIINEALPLFLSSLLALC